MNLVANSLLALGASPVMASCVLEVEEVMSNMSALYLNIGTITSQGAEAMLKATVVAKDSGVPVVLDPVGVGMSSLRRKICAELLQTQAIKIVRGNASEILALDGGGESISGVDAMHSVDAAKEADINLAKSRKLVVGLTGEQDLVTDGEELINISGGHSLMTRVTGMGCALSALMAAWLAVEKNALIAAKDCLAMVGRTGSLAAAKAGGPGTFVPLWLDALYHAR